MPMTSALKEKSGLYTQLVWSGVGCKEYLYATRPKCLVPWTWNSPGQSIPRLHAHFQRGVSINTTLYLQRKQAVFWPVTSYWSLAVRWQILHCALSSSGPLQALTSHCTQTIYRVLTNYNCVLIISCTPTSYCPLALWLQLPFPCNMDWQTGSPGVSRKPGQTR